ncbi:MAG: chemotaxis protein CheW [Acidobacteriota bacterium]|jgi:purine-binding chemotaxis protein CheW|nr:chemotaxis protein CheW [Acidobacteriota bacterium]
MSDNDLDGLLNRSVVQMCTFRMVDRLFGVDILDVKEVNENVNVTPIYHAPPDVCGYINIRGQILLVVNLHETFGLEKQKTEQISGGKIVVFKQSVDEPFGILVDEVCDVVPIEPKRIVDRRSSSGDSAEARELRRVRDAMVVGVYPLEKELLLIVDARRILDAGGKTIKPGEAA